MSKGSMIVSIVGMACITLVACVGLATGHSVKDMEFLAGAVFALFILILILES